MTAERAQSDEQQVFPVGAVVGCRTSAGEPVEGEVVAFDQGARLLALKLSASTATKAKIRFINLALVSAVQIVREAQSARPLPQLHGCQLQTAQKRLTDNVQRKRQSIPHVDVSVEGKLLFKYIAKTLHPVWDGPFILAINNVRIKPPYTASDVEVVDETRSDRQQQTANTVEHVRKIVEQHELRRSQDASLDRSTDDSAASDAPPVQQP